MTTATKAVKPVITAPKIKNAWVKVCDTSIKSENEIVKAIENLSATMILESRLSVTDQKRFIKGLEGEGNVSSFVKSSHAPALPTWSKLRALHPDFCALPVAKQLSTASASYDLLGAGYGEQFGTLEALQKEIATIRKAKNDKSATPKTDKPAKAPKTVRDTLTQILAFANALEIESIGEEDFDLVLEIAAVLEQKVAVSEDAE